MKDLLHTALNWLDHNRWTAAGLALGVAIMLAVVGCEPRAISPVSGEPATAAQIQADVEGFIAQQQAAVAAIEANVQAAVIKAEAAVAEINARKAAIAEAILTLQEVLGGFAGPVGAPLVSLAGGLALSAFGIGALVDNRRKDSVITALKSTT